MKQLHVFLLLRELYRIVLVMILVLKEGENLNYDHTSALNFFSNLFSIVHLKKKFFLNFNSVQKNKTIINLLYVDNNLITKNYLSHNEICFSRLMARID